MEVFYQYDLNDTTELVIKVYDSHLGSLQKPVQVFSRNSMPGIGCDSCGQNSAVRICQACESENIGWLCGDCLNEHDCHEHFLLPIVNSPRAGMCHYYGDIR